MRQNHLIEPIQAVLDIASEPVSEYDLIQILQSQGWLDSIEAGNPLSLYTVHFLVYNALYQLNARYKLAKEPKHVRISALAIELVEVGNGAASEKGADDVVAYAQDSQSEVEGLVAFYLDWSNIDDATKDSVNDLLNTFWQKYVADDDYAQALAILGATAENSYAEIKKRYRQLAMLHHPDRGGEESIFLEVQRAFSLVQRRVGNKG